MLHSTTSSPWLAILAVLGIVGSRTAVAQLTPVTASNSSAPIVDLGYEVHRAVVNETGQYFNFSNIRYGEPPVGILRFRDPIAPTTINRNVQEAPENRICFQAMGGWQAQAGPFIGSIIAGPNASLAGGINSAPPAGGGAPPPAGAFPLPGTQTDDCLFLDVFSPASVFNAAQGAAGAANKGAPVIIWIHGGGHANGWKNQVGSPAGLLAESQLDGRTGVVFVEINYRLGLFGYPPRKQGDTTISSNAGLLDQRLAIDWVVKNIHLFGGDPNQITLMGESAGANSILFHISSFGGRNGPLPFQRAIIQSPAWRPTSDAVFYEQLLGKVLTVGNLTSLDAARELSGAQLQTVNQAIVGSAAYAAFDFGTNIDGGYIPASPGVLFATGQYDKSIKMIVGHNSNEGLLFTDASVNDQAAFVNNIQNFAPRASPEQVQTIATVLYPEDFSGARGYKTQTERLAIAMREGVVESFSFALKTALGQNNQTFSYVFGQFPGIHAQDLSYTFFDGEPVDAFGSPIVPSLAKIVQSAVIQFTLTGDPNVAGGPLPPLPLYGPTGTSLFFNSTVVANIADTDASDRSLFWQEGLYNVSISASQSSVTTDAQGNEVIVLAVD